MNGAAGPEAARLREGLLLALAAYGLWGLLPLLFKYTDGATPAMILAHRVLWSMLFLLVVTAIGRRWSLLRSLVARSRATAALALSAALIATNWLIYIVAVKEGHVVQASLGYFINPLVNVLLGTAFLGERLRGLQWMAVLLAAVGVLILTLAGGSIPWVSLVLAFSFGFYGLVRKLADVPAFEGLVVETGLLFPFALGYLLLVPVPSFAELPAHTAWLLLLAGPATAIPLLCFAAAARRLAYGTLGIIQYLAPTLQLLIAVLVFGEPFRPVQAVTFAFIWAGIVLYVVDSLRVARSVRRTR